MKKIIKSIFLIILIILLAMSTASCYRAYFSELIGVDGISMLPTYRREGDAVTIRKNGYTINRNDIIVFYRLEGEEQSDLTIDDSPAAHKNDFQSFIKEFCGILGIDYKYNYINGDTADKFKCVIKRVVAVGGDIVQIADGLLYINGELLQENYLNEPMVPKNEYTNVGVTDNTWRLKSDELFVLGDNRNYSFDSEDYGPINVSQVLGKVTGKKELK